MKPCAKLKRGTKLYIVAPHYGRPGTACSHFRHFDVAEFRPLKEITLAQHTVMIQIYGAGNEDRWNVWTGACSCEDTLFKPFWEKENADPST